MVDSAWPPPYTIRRSQRAKHIGLSVTAKGGLEVIVPTHYQQNDFVDILNEKRRWIEKHLKAVQQQPHREPSLPDALSLLALDEQWRVSYIQQLSAHCRIMHRPHNEIVLLGNTQQKNHCFLALRKWLQQYAKQRLIPWFQQISGEIQLPYQSVTMRGQTTRWGSCSSRKSISLNFKLLFLRPELARYVMVHELCHTVHLNHSGRFWRLVEKFDPRWQIHKEQLEHIRQEIPLWLDR